MQGVLALLLLASCGRIGFDPIGTTAGGPDAPSGPANLVFITSTTTVVGAIGSLAAADAQCASRAAAEGLPGSYVAFLSTPSVNAIDRIAGARGWVRLDDKPFADTPTDIVDGRIWHPVAFDERGVDLGDTDPVTGTTEMGTHGTSCNGFTNATSGSADIGSARGTTINFMNSVNVSVSCSAARPFYCIGISNVTPIANPSATGRVAFLSATPWQVSGGLAGADAHCQNEATAASIPGTFRALLATSSAGASSRFDLGGPRWVRVDGVALGDSAAESLQANVTTLNVDSLGGYLRVPVWTGSNATVDDVGVNTCSNWTNPASSGAITLASMTVNLFYSGASGIALSRTCSSTLQHLYCLQI